MNFTEHQNDLMLTTPFKISVSIQQCLTILLKKGRNTHIAHKHTHTHTHTHTRIRENKMAQSEHFRLSKLAHVRYQGYLQETTVTAAAGSSRPKGQRKGK